MAEAGSQRALTRVALVLGGVTIVGGLGLSALTYRLSRDALAQQLTQASALLANSVRSHGEDLVARGMDTDQALRGAWEHSRGDDQGLYLCFVRKDGKLNIHTKRSDLIGTSVAGMTAAAPEETPRDVLQLLHERRSWSGEI
jgi:hypothetical protein